MTASLQALSTRPARPASLDPLVVPIGLEALDVASYPYDLGHSSCKIQTSSATAQKWFGDGLQWVYGFNHEEAVRCFQQALLHDPTCAMAFWGISYAHGANYNRPFQLRSKEELPGLLSTCIRAAELAIKHASDPLEKVLAEALILRYPTEPSPSAAELKRCTRLWGDRMRDVYAEHGDNLDVAAIYADSRMNLAPWQLWDIPTGKPNADAHTLEVRDVLAKALNNPASRHHAGILHLQIHLMELSPTPEAAIVPGDHLRNLVPASGHLAHMPSHIDIVMGDYRRAIASNEQAMIADRLYERCTDDADFYTLYRVHNADFLVYAALFSGQLDVARSGLAEIERILSDRVLRSGDLADWFEAFLSDRPHVLVRFGLWDEILSMPMPDDPVLYSVTTATLRYARGIAHAVLGNIPAAEEEQRLFLAAWAAVQPSRMMYPNSMRTVLAVGESMLAGELDYRKGNFGAAFAHLREAVDRSDNLVYSEPWGWMQPPRHALAALLLEQGHTEEAAAVYAADLGLNTTLPRAHRHPRNVWALHGYHECLRKLGQSALADVVKFDLDIALAVADVKIRATRSPRPVKAVIADPDCGRPTVEEIPFGTRSAVKDLGPDAIVVSARALSLNPTDYKHAHGDWSTHKKVVVGSDSAGVVLQVGSNVKHIKVGDRVAGLVYGCGSEDNGAAAEAVVIDAANAFPLPSGMSFLEGAALTLTHLTVVQALYMQWKLPKPSSASSSSPKKIILVCPTECSLSFCSPSGSTAVGHHAVQLARLSGFRVFVTASPGAHALMRELGADEVFDYRDPHVVDAIKKAAGEEGVFAAYDTAGSNLGQCIDAIGPQGGKVMSTTPFDEAMTKRRSDVTVGFVLVYTLVGYPLTPQFTFAGAFDFPAIPEHRAASLDWVTKELPALLDGWVEGKGSPLYKGQSLRVLDGGLEQVYEGLDILRRGAYKAEKLVYKLA